jgi:hypothetical protein
MRRTTLVWPPIINSDRKGAGEGDSRKLSCTLTTRRIGWYRGDGDRAEKRTDPTRGECDLYEGMLRTAERSEGGLDSGAEAGANAVMAEGVADTPAGNTLVPLRQRLRDVGLQPRLAIILSSSYLS